MLRALTYPPFALLWTGQTISRLGDSFYRIALAWWVLEKTGSASVMGTVLVFLFAPMLIFTLIGGVAVDRFSRLRIMFASDVLRGLLLAFIAFMAFSNRLEIWQVYLAAVVFGVVDAFFQPAYTAVLPQIVLPAALNSANSLTSVSAQAATILGPSLGAMLVGLGGTSLTFALDGVSFFISAGLILPIIGLSLPARSSLAPQSVLHDLREGIATVLTRPWLWITILIAALANVTLSGPMNVSLPFLVKDNLKAGVTVLGVIGSVVSAGSVIGAISIGRYKRIHHRGLVAYSAWLAGGLAVMAYGLFTALPGVLAAAVIFGASLSIFGLIWTNTLQELVPSDLLGRVASIDILGSFVLLPVGYVVAGWATDRLGAATVFIIGGALTAILIGSALIHPAIRTLD